MKRISASLFLVCVLLLVLPAGTSSEDAAFPEPVGYVNDFTGMISPRARTLIDALARQVKAKTGAELVVATIPTTGGMDIERYSTELFMAWGIGEKGKDNGVLVLVAVEDQALWVKPGYGLEGAVPDAVAHRIYRDVLRPGFRAGRYDEALVTAGKLLAERILAEYGENLALEDSIPDRYLLTGRSGRQRRSPLLPFLFVLFPFSVFILFRVLGGRRGVGGRRGGFWIGGVGGSSGGFGGGFGGFGGGGCGGAGAGGGW
jgi:uncharacterized protein